MIQLIAILWHPYMWNAPKKSTDFSERKQIMLNLYVKCLMYGEKYCQLAENIDKNNVTAKPT